TIGDVAVALQEQGVGAQTMAAMVVVGDALSLSADETRGTNHQETPVGDLECHCAQSQQWPGRRHQQSHQNDQSAQQRIPQQATLRQCHLFLLGRTRSLPCYRSQIRFTHLIWGRAQKHCLTNLNLRYLNILDVEELGEEFDLIVSSGVLHHLPDPGAGLRKLKAVLLPHGVMSIAVYGWYRRIGVYMMQDAFRLLGIQQTRERSCHSSSDTLRSARLASR
ncbi:MAG: hypothetical protein ACI8W7_000428, partial [Gammaproteobacteria bacterium]